MKYKFIEVFVKLDEFYAVKDDGTITHHFEFGYGEVNNEQEVREIIKILEEVIKRIRERYGV